MDLLIIVAVVVLVGGLAYFLYLQQKNAKALAGGGTGDAKTDWENLGNDLKSWAGF